MPWMECNLMDQKLKFIARLLEGEKMAPLCREFGITRPTGYRSKQSRKRSLRTQKIQIKGNSPRARQESQ